jgi:hypothetical protein
MGTRKKASWQWQRQWQWQLAPVEVTLPSGLQYCYQKTMAAGDVLIVENVLMPTRIKKRASYRRPYAGMVAASRNGSSPLTAIDPW